MVWARREAGALTGEQLEVGQGLREHAAALLLHRQGDDHQGVGQLGKVLDEVVLSAGEKAEGSKARRSEPLGSGRGKDRPRAIAEAAVRPKTARAKAIPGVLGPA